MKLLHLLKNHNMEDVEIVSGGARGADTLGEQFAKKHGCKIKRFIPDWEGLGKQAGFIRNWDMAMYADACVVFMKKEGTKGSQHMINLAEKEGLLLRVVYY